MIKKTKEAFKQIAEKIENAIEYNKNNPASPIKLIQIEISRGLYNIGDEELFKKVKEEINAEFKLCTNDHDDYIMLFINLG